MQNNLLEKYYHKFSAKKASEKLNISKSKLYKLLKENKIPLKSQLPEFERWCKKVVLNEERIKGRTKPMSFWVQALSDHVKEEFEITKKNWFGKGEPVFSFENKRLVKYSINENGAIKREVVSRNQPCYNFAG
jgi:hypothetical protein